MRDLDASPVAGLAVAAGPAAPAHSAVLTGTLGYLTASLLWGLNLPLSAALLKHFDPFWVSPLRYVIATVLLGAMLARREQSLSVQR